MKDGIALTNIHHPDGDPVPDDHKFKHESLETIEIDIPMSIKELAEQAGFEVGEVYDIIYRNYENEFIVCSRLERFAELIRADERNKCAQDYLHDCADAVEAARLDEREANAKLAEITCCKCMDTAEAIRQRSENEPS